MWNLWRGKGDPARSLADFMPPWSQPHTAKRGKSDAEMLEHVRKGMAELGAPKELN